MTDIKKKPRLSILLKIALLFICALVISAAFTITFSYLFMIEDAARQESEIARVVATSVRADLNTEEDITRLEQDAEFRNETHDMFKNICLESGARYLYLYKLTEDNKKHYLVIAARDDEDDALLNEEYGYESGILRDQPLYTAEESVVNGNHGGDYEFVNNEYGNVCMYIIPVLDAKDRIVALIGVDYAVDSIIDILNDNVKALVLQGLFITGLTVVIALLLIRKRIIRPIKSLSGRMAGFVQDRDKNPGSGVSKTFFEDEMTDIERSFDKMAEDISEYVGNIEKLTLEKGQVNTQLEIARKIQCGIVPMEHGLTGDGYGAFGYGYPAREVGGDFYDIFFPDPDNICVVIGDISGKGVSAAMFMVMVRTAISENLRTGLSPADALSFVNREVCLANPETMFATVMAVKLNIKTGILNYANMGHNPPVFLSKEPSFYRMESGTLLGLFEDADISEGEIQLNDGEGMLLYTDGITEAVNADKKQYGEQKLLGSVKRSYEHNENNYSSYILVSDIIESVKEFATGVEQFDDITCAALIYRNNEKSSKNLSADMESFNAVKRTIMLSVGNNDTTKKIILACEEMFSSIVAHSKADSISFSCERTENSYSITFSDDGVPFDPLETHKHDGIPVGVSGADEASDADDISTADLGILIAQNKAKKMIYNRIDDRNILTLMFDIQ